MLREMLDKRTLVTCDPDTKVSEVCKIMADHDVGAVLVTNNDRPTGIITDRDIVVRCIAQNIDVDDCTVEQIMSESLETCRDIDGLYDCIMKMKKAKVRRMPVVDEDGKAVGIISFGDMLGVLAKEFTELVETTTPLAEQRKKEPRLRAA